MHCVIQRHRPWPNTPTENSEESVPEGKVEGVSFPRQILNYVSKTSIRVILVAFYSFFQIVNEILAAGFKSEEIILGTIFLVLGPNSDNKTMKTICSQINLFQILFT